MEFDGPCGREIAFARAKLRNTHETSQCKAGQPAPERPRETMDKTAFMTTLQALNADLRAAIADGDFDEVRCIDRRRQELLHRIAVEHTTEGDEDLFGCLEGFSSEVAENIKQVEKQFSGFSRRASGRYKLLDGYRI